MSFWALVTDKSESGEVTSSVLEMDENSLPEGNVTVSIEWAGLNYKDGLCLTGGGGLVRNYPHVAGIDFAGSVIESSDDRYAEGDGVVLTGWRVGEARWGGYATKARVNADWLVPLPKGLSARDAMVIGTAGLTAQLAISRLEENGLKPDLGEVLVTGAGGGVGSIAVMLLANSGYDVVGLTGRTEMAEALKKLGAHTVLPRAELSEPSRRILESERWAGVIDSAGGPILGNILKQVKYGCGVASIGLAGGASWDGSVIPFILRGVSLYGIDSVMQPFSAREKAWNKLAVNFSKDLYATMVTEVGLEELSDAAQRILKGQIKGRVIVNPQAI